MIDPEYMRLYRRYVKAMKAYEILLEKRRASRAAYKKRKNQPAVPRRPVGSPPSAKKPVTTSAKTGKGTKPQDMRVYLGSILGWYTLVKTSPQIPSFTKLDFDANAAFDRTQLRIYMNAKDYYLKCKKEFFDYARRGPGKRGGRRPTTGYQKNLARAKGHSEFAASAQMLGFDKMAENAIENMQREVESACYELWDNYRENPENKQVISDLINHGLVQAQLVGLDDSPIVTKISNEINKLINSGKFNNESNANEPGKAKISPG